MNLSLSRPLLACLSGLLLAGCGSSQPKPGEEVYPVKPGIVHQRENDYVEFVGQVVYVGEEGGFYGLKVGETRYDPLQLPDQFQVDGKRVYVRAHVRDWVSGRNWGRMVHVVAIDDCCEAKPEPEED